MLNAMDYRGRVETGRIIEKEILDVLRKAGIVIEEPTAEEDMQDKIDGWMMWFGERKSIQVKFREGGDDILFEVVKDLKKNIPGRDSVSKADFYMVMDCQKTIRLFLAAPFKRLAQQLIPIAKGLHKTGKTSWQGDRWQLKITIDKASGNTKLMGFFNPGKFECLGEWHK